MQHARVATYRVTSGTADEIVQRAQAGMLPIFRGQPGFVGYGVVTTGDGQSIVSISVWQTGDQANAAVQAAAQWVRENLAGKIELQHNYIGDVSFFESAGPIGA